MASIKEMIHDIEEASEELLVPKHEDHLAKELLQEAVMTDDQIIALIKDGISHFSIDRTAVLIGHVFGLVLAFKFQIAKVYIKSV